MRNIPGQHHLLRAVFVTLLALSGASFPVQPAGAEVLLYRGDHVYVLPKRLVKRMLELASSAQWQHFNDLNREVDTDGDGEVDFHAIALGAEGGYGVQIRYRLHAGPQSDSRRLGRWYWGVITGPGNEVILEAFNL